MGSARSLGSVNHHRPLLPLGRVSQHRLHRKQSLPLVRFLMHGAAWGLMAALAAPAAGWSSDGVTSSFLNAINMRKKAAAHHAPGALKPKALTAPPKAAISTGAASSSVLALPLPAR